MAMHSLCFRLLWTLIKLLVSVLSYSQVWVGMPRHKLGLVTLQHCTVNALMQLDVSTLVIIIIIIRLIKCLRPWLQRR